MILLKNCSPNTQNENAFKLLSARVISMNNSNEFTWGGGGGYIECWIKYMDMDVAYGYIAV